MQEIPAISNSNFSGGCADRAGMDQGTAGDVLFNSRSLEVSKQTLEARNCQNNGWQAKKDAYTLEEVVQLADTRRHTQVDCLVTKVHDKPAEQRGVDLHASASECDPKRTKDIGTDFVGDLQALGLLGSL